MVVEDAQDDPRFSSHVLVASDPYVRFYCGVPVVTTDGYAVGTIAVMDPVPRRREEKECLALKRLARQAAAAGRKLLGGCGGRTRGHTAAMAAARRGEPLDPARLPRRAPLREPEMREAPPPTELAQTLGRQFVVTVEMQLRYRRPLRTEEPIVARAKVTKIDGRDVHVTGTLASNDGEVLTEGSARFRMLTTLCSGR